MKRRNLQAPGYYVAALDDYTKRLTYYGPFYLARALDDAEWFARRQSRRTDVLVQRSGAPAAEVVATAVPALCAECDGTPFNAIALRMQREQTSAKG